MSGRWVGAPRGAALTGLAAVAIAPLVPARRSVERMDHALLQAVVARRPDAVRIPAVRLTELAEPTVILPLCVVAAARALSRRTSPPEVLGRLGWAAAGIGLRRGLAETVRRGRPPAAWWWHSPSGFSYPSRHVTWAVLGLGTAADLLGGGPGYRRAAAALTAGVVATRVLLAVHWPSDVVAALVYSAAWRRLSTPTRLPRGSHGR